MENRMVLQLADILVIVAMLLVPLGIGVYFAIKDANRTTRDVYLLGGRSMTMIPVTLSLFVTFQSAISMIGVPSEVYLHGPMVLGWYIGVAIAYVLSYYTVVPLLYSLQLTSVYEYVEMRFQSKAVRILSTIMGIIQNFFYMVIALLAPGLALEAAAGIPLWVSVAIVGGTGTIYTAAGGIKSVIWTDVFQTLILFIGVYGVVIKSIYDVGGPQNAFEIVKEGGRIKFDSINPDPRVRHSWWTTTIGTFSMWLAQIFNQSTIQRISSMKSMRDARRSMLVNIPINLFYGFTVILFGWCLYAYLHYIRCDPVHADMLTNYNQLSPFFVIHVMQNVPGMAGLYMSSVFSAALSTISSGINALAANTVEDIIQKPLKSLSEKTVTTITKILALFYGAAIIGMAYLAKSAQGPVTQMSMSVVGLFGSCIVGMILLGCTVPWANKFGAVTGCVVSLSINLWLGIGARLYGRPAQPLPPVPSDHCFNSTTVENNIFTEYDITKYQNQTDILTNVTNEADQLPDVFSPYDISYMLYGFIGIVVCYVVGLIVSRITRNMVKTNTDPMLIFGCLRGFWNLNEQDEFANCEGLMDDLKNKCRI